mmetsp:Transcript_53319/g.79233  ORF Transcript_53319/g.79233 Transcript_53319/m.79233 type:complete len:117 (+) Transcript_53319:82-432(+)
MCPPVLVDGPLKVAGKSTGKGVSLSSRTKTISKRHLKIWNVIQKVPHEVQLIPKKFSVLDGKHSALMQTALLVYVMVMHLLLFFTTYLWSRRTEFCTLFSGQEDFAPQQEGLFLTE